MRGHRSVELIILLLCTAVFFTACAGSSSSGSAGENPKITENNVALAEAKIAGRHENPDGQEIILENAGLYIMLPDRQWRLSSQEDGYISYSSASGLINIYYSDDDGSAYKNAPESTDDVAKILKDADISEEWFEIVSFEGSEKKGVKNYSYVIRFNIPDEEGNYSEFYSISKSVCTGSKAYVASGQIYTSDALEACETAINSFAVFN